MFGSAHQDLNESNFKEKKLHSSSTGFEPAASGLEVQRAIHCATKTCFSNDELYVYVQIMHRIPPTFIL